MRITAKHKQRGRQKEQKLSQQKKNASICVKCIQANGYFEYCGKKHSK